MHWNLVSAYFIFAKVDPSPFFFLLFIVVIVVLFYIKEWIRSTIERRANEHAIRLIEEKKREINNEIGKIKKEVDKYAAEKRIEINRELQRLNEVQVATKKILEERQIGFPWLADKISKAITIVYKNSYQRRESYKYRQSLKDIEILKGIIEFHEYLYPHLKELHVKIDETPPEENSNYIESERADEAHFWLTPEEYRSLPSAERNQLALDRYRKRHLSEWEVGKRYERYIGFTFELKGYKVDYDGISYRKEDRGRDLICEKGDEVLIIQCKNWSHSKTIYEKHIFQFFGTVFYARIEEKKRNPMAPRKVKGLFFTTTKLSDYAIEAANALNIDIILEPIDKDYPCIKCNIRNGEKIYHLPFDQLYDRTKIIPNTGEFYAKTCQEAETHGFRRAMKHFY